MRTHALAAAGMLAGASSAAFAAPFFSDTFDTAGSSANWLTTTVAGAGDTVTYGFDYSTKGLPEAPNTPSLTVATRGLFIQTNKNIATGVINGLNVTASAGGVAINFNQDIKMTFDMWLGVDPTLVSTTEQALYGINTDGAGVNSRTGATQSAADGVWYHVAGEGGYGNTSTTPNSRDVVNYINNGVSGRLDNAEAPFPALFPNGPLVGTPGNSWVRVEISEVGGNVKMLMNGGVIFDVANTGPTSGSVFLGYQDPFSGSLGSNALQFGVFDNVVVEAVPEPTSLAIVGVAALAALRRRR